MSVPHPFFGTLVIPGGSGGVKTRFGLGKRAFWVKNVNTGKEGTDKFGGRWNMGGDTLGPGPHASHETEYECSSLSARPRFSSMSPHARGFPRGHACRGRGHLRRIVGVAPVVWGNSTRLHMASIENMYMVTRNRRARCFFLGHAHVPGARPCSPAALGREADQRGSGGRLSCPRGQMRLSQVVARMTPPPMTA